MSPLVKRGRAIVGTIVVSHLLLSLGVIVLALVLGKFDQLPRLGIKLIATASTAYGLWQGGQWAKWLYVFGFCMAALACLFLAVGMRPVTMTLTASVGVMFSVLAGLLAFAPSVNSFLAYQRGARVFEYEDEEEEEEEEEFLDLSGRLCAACGHAETGVNMFCSQCGHRIG